MFSQRLAGSILNRLNRAIEQKVFPGCVAGLVARNGERMVLPAGRFIYDNDAPPVVENSIFDIASITKAIPVSCLALRMIGEGVLRSDDAMIRYLPEFRNAHRSEIRIIHLLTHTIDFGFRLSSFKNRPADEIINAIMTGGFASSPGAKYCYANATSILLGMVVERIAGCPLDVCANRNFFGPLRMDRTSFSTESFYNAEILPTEIDDSRGGEVRGKVHDESAFALRAKMVPGSAGIFSTVPDLLIFAEMLLNNGLLNGYCCIGPAMIAPMYTNQLAAIGERTGLGWELSQPRFMGSRCSPSTFGKTGFTGCSIVCEPALGFALVLLSNHTWPHRRPDRSLIDAVRRDLADIVFESCLHA